MRLRTVYGAEYLRHFPDEASVNIAKREWFRQIGKYSREQIDGMFSHAKAEQMRGNDEYNWLNIGNILAILGSSWQHAAQSRYVDEVLERSPIAIEDLTAKEARRETGKQKLAAMRAALGI